MFLSRCITMDHNYRPIASLSILILRRLREVICFEDLF